MSKSTEASRVVIDRIIRFDRETAPEQRLAAAILELRYVRASLADHSGVKMMLSREDKLDLAEWYEMVIEEERVLMSSKLSVGDRVRAYMDAAQMAKSPLCGVEGTIVYVGDDLTIKMARSGAEIVVSRDLVERI